LSIDRLLVVNDCFVGTATQSFGAARNAKKKPAKVIQDGRADELNAGSGGSEGVVGGIGDTDLSIDRPPVVTDCFVGTARPNNVTQRFEAARNAKKKPAKVIQDGRADELNAGSDGSEGVVGGTGDAKVIQDGRAESILRLQTTSTRLRCHLQQISCLIILEI